MDLIDPDDFESEPFEQHISLAEFVRQECKTDEDLEFLFRSLVNGDVVAGFLQHHSNTPQMFVIPPGTWRTEENQQKIRAIRLASKSKADAEILFDMNHIGIFVLNELRAVLRYLQRQEPIQRPLTVTGRLFGKLLMPPLSAEATATISRRVNSIAETFILQRQQYVSPMLDTSNQKKLRELMPANTGRPQSFAPDSFWKDLIEFMVDYEIQNGKLIKQTALIAEFENKAYFSEDDKKMLSISAKKDRCRLVWSIWQKRYNKKSGSE